MISTTRMPPTSACSLTLLIARSMKIALSSSTVSCTPGTSRLMRATSARMPCATATVFSPDCLLICMRTPECPSPSLPLASREVMRRNWRRSSVASAHVGDVAAGRPERSRRVSTTRLRMSSMLPNCPWLRTRYVESP